MGPRDIFAWLFLPEGYPDSVAPEYARYQLWDTAQQVTYFVNTVISMQAMMKFHGVGDVHASPAGATALSMSRSALGSVVSLVFTVPSMTHLYKVRARRFRLLAEIQSALGHFLEILAASFPVAALLYAGPVVLSASGAMGGAVRSVIMTRFAQRGNNGDVSLKESNQDKGGRVFGLVGGLLMLTWINMSSDNTAAEESPLRRSAICFGALSIVHIACNVAAVNALQFPHQASKASIEVHEHRNGNSTSFLRAMFLPPGYPHTVAPGYSHYQTFQAMCDLTNYPKALVTQLFFWKNVYGVGDGSMTPADAVHRAIFISAVECFVGLISGLPFIARRFYGNFKAWRFRSTIIGPVLGDTVYLLAAVGPRDWFYVVIVVGVALQAFAGLSRKVVDAEITKNWSRSPNVELIHITVAARNQSVVVQLLTGLMSISYAFRLAGGGASAPLPPLSRLLPAYAGLQALKAVSALGASYYAPDPSPQASATDPLLAGAADAIDSRRGQALDATHGAPIKGQALAGVTCAGAGPQQ